MKDYNLNITDKEIRELLKRRLLEQDEDDLLTKNLIDMEAKLAFSNEALLAPSLQKENELLQKLSAANGSGIFLKWLLTGFFVVLITMTFLIYNRSVSKPAIIPTTNKMISPKKNNNNLPVVSLIDSTYATESTTVVKKRKEKSITSYTIKPRVDEKRIVSNPEIKADYIPAPSKRETKSGYTYGNIPVFTEKQIAANTKLKEKMIKALLKKDKSVWAYISKGSDVFYGGTISAFYIATTEVTNQQYSVFLNDLVIHNKIKEYLKAVPDTTKWNIPELGDNWEMVNVYFWHHKYINYPVVNVSREGAGMYCEWLTIETNQKIKMNNPLSNLESLYINDVRIPRETEWMMAARGENLGAEYPWGTDRVQNEKGCFLCNFGLYKSMDKVDTVNNSCSQVRDALTSVGSILGVPMLTAPSNSYNPYLYGLYCSNGLYGMSGNAAEMVWQNKTNKPGTKGGSWNSDCNHIKTNAADEYEGIIEASPFIGFRPVFTAKKSK